MPPKWSRKLADVIATNPKYAVARDVVVNESESVKEYMACCSSDDVIRHAQHCLSTYTVVLGNRVYAYWDIDAAVTAEGLLSSEMLREVLLMLAGSTFVLAVVSLGERLPIMVFDASAGRKISFHIHMSLQLSASELYNETCRLFADAPRLGVDTSVYKPYQLFRLPYATKGGETRPLWPVSPEIFDYATSGTPFIAASEELWRKSAVISVGEGEMPCRVNARMLPPLPPMAEKNMQMNVLRKLMAIGMWLEEWKAANAEIKRGSYAHRECVFVTIPNHYCYYQSRCHHTATTQLIVFNEEIQFRCWARSCAAETHPTHVSFHQGASFLSA